MSNPATLADLTSFVQAGARRIQRDFRRPDDDWDMVFFVQTDEGITPLPVPNGLMERGDTKSLLAEAMRKAVVEMGAYRYAVLLNMHYVPMQAGTPEEMDAVLDVITEIREERVRVQRLEGSVEALMLIVGDAEEERMWMCEIKRHACLPPKLGAWQSLDDEEMGFSGRFTGINRYMQNR